MMSELEGVLKEIEAFFAAMPLASWDWTTLQPSSSAALANLGRVVGHPLNPELDYLLRRGARFATVSFDREEVWEEDESSDDDVHKHEPGFGGFECMHDAGEIAAGLEADRALAAEIDDPELAKSMRVFQIRPDYRVRLADGAVLYGTDNGRIVLAPSLTAFFQAWLAIGCFRGHDYRTYARGLQRSYRWVAPDPTASSLLRVHDAIYRTTFSRFKLRSSDA